MVRVVTSMKALSPMATSFVYDINKAFRYSTGNCNGLLLAESDYTPAGFSLETEMELRFNYSSETQKQKYCGEKNQDFGVF